MSVSDELVLGLCHLVSCASILPPIYSFVFLSNLEILAGGLKHPSQLRYFSSVILMYTQSFGSVGKDTFNHVVTDHRVAYNIHVTRQYHGIPVTFIIVLYN
jgi:hypothetical protein